MGPRARDASRTLQLVTGARGPSLPCLRAQCAPHPCPLQSVTALTEHDARACKRLANRAHEVKEALRKSQASVRHNTEAARRHSFEVRACVWSRAQ